MLPSYLLDLWSVSHISTVEVEQYNFISQYYLIAVTILNVLDQIDAKKLKNVSRKTYTCNFLKVKLWQSLKKSWINMIFVQCTVLANSSNYSNQIARPYVTFSVTIKAIEHFFRVYIASSKHEKGWENSGQLSKPEM